MVGKRKGGERARWWEREKGERELRSIVSP